MRKQRRGEILAWSYLDLYRWCLRKGCILHVKNSLKRSALHNSTYQERSQRLKKLMTRCFSSYDFAFCGSLTIIYKIFHHFKESPFSSASRENLGSAFSFRIHHHKFYQDWYRPVYIVISVLKPASLSLVIFS